MLDVRIVNVDHYMATPVRGFDPVYSDFRGTSVSQVPVIRIFGTTDSGKKTCLHIHGVFPYIYVPFDGESDPSQQMYQLAASLDKALNIALGTANSARQHIYKVIHVKGVPFYGYHEKSHQFLKIYFYNPLIVKKATDLLQNGAVCNKIFQCHEAHLPFILQFFIDYNLHGMSFIQLESVDFRQELGTVHSNLDLGERPAKTTYCELEADALASDILNRKTISDGEVANPGLAGIWSEERLRNNVSQLSENQSQERPAAVKTLSEVLLRQRLRDALAELSGRITGNSSVSTVLYPAETSPDYDHVLDASLVGGTVEGGPCTPGGAFMVNMDESIIDEQLVLSLSQAPADSQDLSLLDIMQSLAERGAADDDDEGKGGESDEWLPLSSQKSVETPLLSQSFHCAQMEADSILGAAPCNAADEEEEEGAAQRVLDGDEGAQNEDCWQDSVWNGLDFNAIPQLDGAPDECDDDGHTSSRRQTLETKRTKQPFKRRDSIRKNPSRVSSPIGMDLVNKIPSTPGSNNSSRVSSPVGMDLIGKNNSNRKNPSRVSSPIVIDLIENKDSNKKNPSRVSSPVVVDAIKNNPVRVESPLTKDSKIKNSRRVSSPAVMDSLKNNPNRVATPLIMDSIKKHPSRVASPVISMIKNPPRVSSPIVIDSSEDDSYMECTPMNIFNQERFWCAKKENPDSELGNLMFDEPLKGSDMFEEPLKCSGMFGEEMFDEPSETNHSGNENAPYANVLMRGDPSLNCLVEASSEDYNAIVGESQNNSKICLEDTELNSSFKLELDESSLSSSPDSILDIDDDSDEIVTSSQFIFNLDYEYLEEQQEDEEKGEEVGTKRKSKKRGGKKDGEERVVVAKKGNKSKTDGKKCAEKKTNENKCNVGNRAENKMSKSKPKTSNKSEKNVVKQEQVEIESDKSILEEDSKSKTKKSKGKNDKAAKKEQTVEIESEGSIVEQELNNNEKKGKQKRKSGKKLDDKMLGNGEIVDFSSETPKKSRKPSETSSECGSDGLNFDFKVIFETPKKDRRISDTDVSEGGLDIENEESANKRDRRSLEIAKKAGESSEINDSLEKNGSPGKKQKIESTKKRNVEYVSKDGSVNMINKSNVTDTGDDDDDEVVDDDNDDVFRINFSIKKSKTENGVSTKITNQPKSKSPIKADGNKSPIKEKQNESPSNEKVNKSPIKGKEDESPIKAGGNKSNVVKKSPAKAVANKSLITTESPNKHGENDTKHLLPCYFFKRNGTPIKFKFPFKRDVVSRKTKKRFLKRTWRSFDGTGISFSNMEDGYLTKELVEEYYGSENSNGNECRDVQDGSPAPKMIKTSENDGIDSSNKMKSPDHLIATTVSSSPTKTTQKKTEKKDVEHRLLPSHKTEKQSTSTPSKKSPNKVKKASKSRNCIVNKDLEKYVRMYNIKPCRVLVDRIIVDEMKPVSKGENNTGLLPENVKTVNKSCIKEPVHSKSSPGNSKETCFKSKQIPVHLESSPGILNETCKKQNNPVHSKTSPGNSKETRFMGKQNPVHSESSPGNLNETCMKQNNPVHSNASPKNQLNKSVTKLSRCSTPVDMNQNMDYDNLPVPFSEFNDSDMEEVNLSQLVRENPIEFKLSVRLDRIDPSMFLKHGRKRESCKIDNLDGSIDENIDSSSAKKRKSFKIDYLDEKDIESSSVTKHKPFQIDNLDDKDIDSSSVKEHKPFKIDNLDGSFGEDIDSSSDDDVPITPARKMETKKSAERTNRGRSTPKPRYRPLKVKITKSPPKKASTKPLPPCWVLLKKLDFDNDQGSSLGVAKPSTSSCIVSKTPKPAGGEPSTTSHSSALSGSDDCDMFGDAPYYEAEPKAALNFEFKGEEDDCDIFGEVLSQTDPKQLKVNLDDNIEDSTTFREFLSQPEPQRLEVEPGEDFDVFGEVFSQREPNQSVVKFESKDCKSSGSATSQINQKLSHPSTTSKVDLRTSQKSESNSETLGRLTSDELFQNDLENSLEKSDFLNRTASQVSETEIPFVNSSASDRLFQNDLENSNFPSASPVILDSETENLFVNSKTSDRLLQNDCENSLENISPHHRSASPVPKLESRNKQVVDYISVPGPSKSSIPWCSASPIDNETEEPVVNKTENPIFENRTENLIVESRTEKPIVENKAETPVVNYTSIPGTSTSSTPWCNADFYDSYSSSDEKEDKGILSFYNKSVYFPENDGSDSDRTVYEILSLDEDCSEVSGEEFKSYIPQNPPPTYNHILKSLSQYGLSEVLNVEPFCSDVADRAQTEVGPVSLKLKSRSTIDLEEYEGVFSKGLCMYRNNLLKVLETKKSSVLAGDRNVVLVPLNYPPSCEEVKKWLKVKAQLEKEGKKDEENCEKVERLIVPCSPGQNYGSDEEHNTLVLTPLSPPRRTHSTPSDCPPGTTLSLTDTPLCTPVPRRNKRKKSSEILKKSSAKLLKDYAAMSSIDENEGESVLSQKDDDNKLQLSDTSICISDETRAHIEAQLKKKARLSCSFQIEAGNSDSTSELPARIDNLQKTRPQIQHQYLTLMILELHVQTRGDLLPDPENDPIRAVFYHIVNDVPEESDTPTTLTGIIAVGDLVAQDENVSVTCVSDEMALLVALVELIRKWDPEMFIGYEIEKLSWGYLIERAYTLGMNLNMELSRVKGAEGSSKYEDDQAMLGGDGEHLDIRLAGRIVLNVWRLLRSEVALQSYTFENIMYHILRRRIPLFSFRALSSWWEHRTQLYRWMTVDHYLVRVRGVAEILDHLDLIGRTSELARLFGIQFYEVLSRGSQFRVESMMLRMAKPENYVAVSPTTRQRAHMRAPESLPLIMEPESRFYSDPVIVLDFQSLYPSIIIAYNYCFSTCLGRVESLAKSEMFDFGCTHLRVPFSTVKKLEENLNFSPCGVAFVNSSVRRGVLPRMLQEILETRLMVKRSMKKNKNNKALHKVLHNRQLGLKLIANVTYGYTSANFSGRMPCIEIGDSVVSKGRETLERAIALVQSTARWRARVVYGDTDSLFVLVPGRSRADAFRIGAEIADAVTAQNPRPVKLKLEKVYQPCILQTKKRYVGHMWESPEQEKPTYDAKGIETVRRDGCPAVAKILQKSLQLLFETKDVSIVKRFILHQFAKVSSGRISIQELTFAREYRGARGYKPGACVPALELARNWLKKDRRSEPCVGARVPYVIVSGAPGVPLIRLVRCPRALLSDPALKVNADYYITRVIAPPLNRCLLLVGANVLNWFASMPRRQAGTGNLPSAGLPLGARKATISQYFATVTCVVCRVQSCTTGVCDQCRAAPQTVAVRLAAQLHDWERRRHLVLTVCQSCCGRTNNIDCKSLDCPVLYARADAERQLSHEPVFRKLQQDYFNCDF